MISKEDYEEPRCVLCMNPKTRIPVDRVIEKLDSYLESKELDRAYSHLKYWLDEAVNGQDEAGELTILGELMGFCRKNNRMDEAVGYAETAIAKVQKNGFSETITGATAILNAGTVYRAYGDSIKSAALYSRAAEIYKDNLNEDDERLGGLYNNFASALTELGEYDKALEKYNKALGIMSRRGDSKLECAITLLNMADLYERKDGFEGAEKTIDDFLDKAFSILTDESIERNGYFEFVLDKCIPAYDHYGQFLRSTELQGLLNH